MVHLVRLLVVNDGNPLTDPDQLPLLPSPCADRTGMSVRIPAVPRVRQKARAFPDFTSTLLVNAAAQTRADTICLQMIVSARRLTLPSLAAAGPARQHGSLILRICRGAQRLARTVTAATTPEHT